MLKKSVAIILTLIMLISIATVSTITVSAYRESINASDVVSYMEGLVGQKNNYVGYCLLFVTKCWENMGFKGSYGWGNATNFANNNRVSTSRDNIPVGADVFFTSPDGNGHIGIYIGGGYFVHAGSKSTYEKSTLTEGYFYNCYTGWGWHPYINVIDDSEPETLRVGVSGSHAYMSWDWDGKADYYNIKLWRNKVWEGDPYRVVWSVKSNEYGLALPKGTYQAYVDACSDNSGYCKMSNVITFTIGDSDVNLNVGVSGSHAYLTWNKDSKADYYNIKIWKNYIWDGDPYRIVWSVKDTEYGLALPKGKYQVFVDACNDNTGYCKMSSVVEFTVSDSDVNLNVGVSGSHAYLTWNKDSKADYYNIKIWKNYIWDGDPYRIVWSVKDTEYGLALPKGKYQVFVDACNDNTGYCKMSSVAEFTVGDSEVTLNAGVTGSQVDFSWNRDSNAQYYNLKIWRNYIWDGKEYQIAWSIKNTNHSLTLPEGTYQAFVDACNDDTGYCKMSSIVEFTVEKSTDPPTNPPTEPPTDPPTTPPTEPPTEPKTIILGDVDGDGVVAILDATAIQRHLASIPSASYNEKAADADGDGSVTILDATAIQRHLAQLLTNENIGKPIA